MIGIYVITNKANNKKYVGQSIDVQIRLCRHITELIKGKHCNIHLQNSFIKHGIENFSFEPLVQCKQEMLNDLEIYYIGLFKSFDKSKGYNKTYGGETPNHTKETRNKISNTQKGRKLPKEWRDNIVNALIGREVTKETRNKIGEKNRKFSKEEQDKIIDMYMNKGYTQKEIAKITNSGKMTINRYLKPYKSIKKKELNNQILKLLEQGVMQVDIANKLNISKSKVTQVKQKYYNE